VGAEADSARGGSTSTISIRTRWWWCTRSPTSIRPGRDGAVLLGSDDGAKVFLNGKEIHRSLRPRRRAGSGPRPAGAQGRLERAAPEDREQLWRYNFYGSRHRREKQLVISPAQKR